MSGSPRSVPAARSGDDSFSESCSEGAGAVLVSPAMVPNVRRAIAVAMVVVLVGSGIAASVSWTRKVFFGDLRVDLAGHTFASYGAIGCRNWQDIELTRSQVPDAAACATLCSGDDRCVAYNFQSSPCEPGWPVPNGCLLFSGECQAERNFCWEMNYKMALQQTMHQQTMHIDGHSVPDDEVNEMFNYIMDGTEEFDLQILPLGRRLSDEDVTPLPLHAKVDKSIGKPMLPTVRENETIKTVMLINHGEGGLGLGPDGRKVTGLVCDYDGVAESNCNFIEEPIEEAGDGGAITGQMATIGNSTAVAVEGRRNTVVWLVGLFLVVVGGLVVFCVIVNLAHGYWDIWNPPWAKKRACFPSSATVFLPALTRQMWNISVGTLLLTSRGYAPVVLNSHQDPAAVTQMVRLATSSNHTLTLSFDHYLPLAGGTRVSARNVVVGDSLLVYSEQGFVPAAVTSVDTVWEEGLWNPYTVSGDLVVNGVLASSHSAWFLEGSGLSEDLTVSVYEGLMKPLVLINWLAPGWLSRFTAAFKNDPRSLDQAGVLEIAQVAYRTLYE